MLLTFSVGVKFMERAIPESLWKRNTAFVGHSAELSLRLLLARGAIASLRLASFAHALYRLSIARSVRHTGCPGTNYRLSAGDEVNTIRGLVERQHVRSIFHRPLPNVSSSSKPFVSWPALEPGGRYGPSPVSRFSLYASAPRWGGRRNKAAPLSIVDLVWAVQVARAASGLRTELGRRSDRCAVSSIAATHRDLQKLAHSTLLPQYLPRSFSV